MKLSISGVQNSELNVLVQGWCMSAVGLGEGAGGNGWVPCVLLESLGVDPCGSSGSGAQPITCLFFSGLWLERQTVREGGEITGCASLPFWQLAQKQRDSTELARLVVFVSPDLATFSRNLCTKAYNVSRESDVNVTMCHRGTIHLSKRMVLQKAEGM